MDSISNQQLLIAPAVICASLIQSYSPVLSVLRFDNEAEALQMANDTKYGLAAGVFTRDTSRALRMIDQIRAGIIWINGYRIVYL